MKKIVAVLLTHLVFVVFGFAQITIDKNRVFGNVEYLGDTSTSGNSKVITGTKEIPAQLVFKYNNASRLG